VTIDTEDSDLFAAADHTKDGKLGQAEFEDFCMSTFVKGINPNYKPGGNTPPAPNDPNSDDSDDSSN
jgi:hypothetical protein